MSFYLRPLAVIIFNEAKTRKSIDRNKRRIAPEIRKSSIKVDEGILAGFIVCISMYFTFIFFLCVPHII